MIGLPPPVYLPPYLPLYPPAYPLAYPLAYPPGYPPGYPSMAMNEDADVMYQVSAEGRRAGVASF